jgi:hypothetical protein
MYIRDTSGRVLSSMDLCSIPGCSRNARENADYIAEGTRRYCRTHQARFRKYGRRDCDPYPWELHTWYRHHIESSFSRLLTQYNHNGTNSQVRMQPHPVLVGELNRIVSYRQVARQQHLNDIKACVPSPQWRAFLATSDKFCLCPKRTLAHYCAFKHLVLSGEFVPLEGRTVHDEAFQFGRVLMRYWPRGQTDHRPKTSRKDRRQLFKDLDARFATTASRMHYATKIAEARGKDKLPRADLIKMFSGIPVRA